MKKGKYMVLLSNMQRRQLFVDLKLALLLHFTPLLQKRVHTHNTDKYRRRAENLGQ